MIGGEDVSPPLPLLRLFELLADIGEDEGGEDDRDDCGDFNIGIPTAVDDLYPAPCCRMYIVPLLVYSTLSQVLNDSLTVDVIDDCLNSFTCPGAIPPIKTGLVLI